MAQLMKKFDAHIIGELNETYSKYVSYVFNKRDQLPDESFDQNLLMPWEYSDSKVQLGTWVNSRSGHSHAKGGTYDRSSNKKMIPFTDIY